MITVVTGNTVWYALHDRSVLPFLPSPLHLKYNETVADASLQTISFP